MAEDEAPQEGMAQDGQPPAPGMRILAQFVRDLSFENPRAPDSLRGGQMPKIDLQVELAARTREDGLYEVDLKLIVGATRDDGVAFHCELVYGGLFQIEGVPPEQMEAMLLIECPRYMFPFARRIIADLTAEGGFPPFRMEPLDFTGIFMARQQQLAAQGNA